MSVRVGPVEIAEAERALVKVAQADPEAFKRFADDMAKIVSRLDATPSGCPWKVAR